MPLSCMAAVAGVAVGASDGAKMVVGAPVGTIEAAVAGAADVWAPAVGWAVADTTVGGAPDGAAAPGDWAGEPHAESSPGAAEATMPRAKVRARTSRRAIRAVTERVYALSATSGPFYPCRVARLFRASSASVCQHGRRGLACVRDGPWCMRGDANTRRGLVARFPIGLGMLAARARGTRIGAGHSFVRRVRQSIDRQRVTHQAD